MMILALLAVLSLAGISASTLEVQISGHDRESKQAFYLCEAGLERAKYEIIKGWGEGTGGGTAPNWTFTFDSATMLPAVQSGGSIGWAANKWVNFMLVDRRGVEYRINAHDAGTYQITDCTGPLDFPGALGSGPGFGRIYYQDDAIAYAGSGTPGANSMAVAPSPGWAADQWLGYALRDDANNVLDVVGNTADTLTLSGTPATAAFAILRAIGAAGTFTLYVNPDDPTNQPGAPNTQWRDSNYQFGNGLWFLRDANGDLFTITNTAYDIAPDRMILTVTGSPATGRFELVTNPWLVTAASPSYSFTSGLTVDYGSVTVDVTQPGGAGEFVVSAVSTSTATGNAKGISVDVRLVRGPHAQINNWRQVR